MARSRSAPGSGGKAPSADSAGAQRRALCEPHAAAGVVQDLPEDARIGGRRVPHRSLAREENERYPAADHLLTKLLREVPRRPQPIGFDVTHRHALRHVDREDDVHAEPSRCALAQVHIRTGECDHEARERNDGKGRLQPPAGAAA